ncbi:hypothetical protein VNO80_02549 [Phaseolus coccineus]|uniref:Uncharacterized protein n=1 Tax=Phaseolus coccineus TaxID=3886 RepID=A0AAN9NPN5_PHACN
MQTLIINPHPKPSHGTLIVIPLSFTDIDHAFIHTHKTFHCSLAHNAEMVKAWNGMAWHEESKTSGKLQVAK